VTLVEVREVSNSIEVNVTLELVIIEASKDCSPIEELVGENLKLSNTFSDGTLEMAIVT
jgi:hypothetical protein